MRQEDNVIDQVTIVEQSNDPASFAGAATRIARISVLLGPDEGRSYKLEDECTLGRSTEATLRLPDRGISRVHARIRKLSGERFMIEDLSSRNGTLVNGKRVKIAELHSGARIQLGPRCLLLFSLHDELEESLAQAKKLEIIGRLSAGINHDFNNLLCVVLANAAYLLELPRNSTLSHAEIRECLEDMRSAAQAGAELTGRLATLVQGGPRVHEPVDLSRLCMDVISVLRDTFPRSVRIEPRVQPGIVVRGVRSHLWQLLLNPCLNARDAIPEGGGALTLEAVLKTADELDFAPPVRAECYVVITVTDSGRGMSPAVLASAFEPFFTTKDIDLGKGLGLATVRKVASEHGGTVHLTSEVDVGTTLRIVLPIAELQGEDLEVSTRPTAHPAVRYKLPPPAAAPSAADSQDADEGVRGTRQRRRVLVAEDDQGLARVFGRALRRAGYEVLWAADSTQALQMFEQQPSPFSAVLLDLDMADTGIHNAHAAIRSRNRELPIILLTGLPEPDGGPAFKAAPTQDVILRKPVDPAVLARVVSMAIRRSGRLSKL